MTNEVKGLKTKASVRQTLPAELWLWVGVKEAAAMLNYSESRFNEVIWYSQRFKDMAIEQKPGQFSVDLLRRFGRGEFK